MTVIKDLAMMTAQGRKFWSNWYRAKIFGSRIEVIMALQDLSLNFLEGSKPSTYRGSGFLQEDVSPLLKSASCLTSLELLAQCRSWHGSGIFCTLKNLRYASVNPFSIPMILHSLSSKCILHGSLHTSDGHHINYWGWHVIDLKELVQGIPHCSQLLFHPVYTSCFADLCLLPRNGSRDHYLRRISEIGADWPNWSCGLWATSIWKAWWIYRYWRS